jgi:hypothetical protein
MHGNIEDRQLALQQQAFTRLLPSSAKNHNSVRDYTAITSTASWNSFQQSFKLFGFRRWAYVLRAIGNTATSTAIEQLIGRILRMPNANPTGVPALDRAYAYWEDTKPVEVTPRNLGDFAKPFRVPRLVVRYGDQRSLLEPIELDTFTWDMNECPIKISEPSSLRRRT